MSEQNQIETTSGASRRDLLKMVGIGATALGLAAAAGTSAFAQPTSEWDKVFPRNEAIGHEKVSFTNRYGVTLVGDLYTPEGAAASGMPAIAVCGPFGAVKEQSSGLYAQTMAERGFIALAFDPSYTGESGGEVRKVASPDINSEDFSAAVDFLGLHPAVDRERIGIVGICGFAGMALNAVAVDKRVKAVATTSMYDMSRVNARGYYDAMTLEQRTELLADLSRQRWADAEAGTAALAGGVPETLDGIDDPVVQMYWHYYRTERGFHERSVNSTTGWARTSALSLMNMPILTYIKEISPRPMLVIAGENAHSRYFTEDAYEAAIEPKEIMIIPDADHVDLYDQMDKIPFDRLQSFFEENLGA